MTISRLEIVVSAFTTIPKVKLRPAKAIFLLTTVTPGSSLSPINSSPANFNDVSSLSSRNSCIHSKPSSVLYLKPTLPPIVSDISNSPVRLPTSEGSTETFTPGILVGNSKSPREPAISSLSNLERSQSSSEHFTSASSLIENSSEMVNEKLVYPHFL